MEIIGNKFYARGRYISIMSIIKKEIYFPMPLYKFVSSIHFSSVKYWIWIMVNSVRLFQCSRELYGIIGTHPLQLSHGTYNLRNVVVLMFITINMLSSGAFFVYEADNIQDYGISFYTFMTALINLSCFPSFRNNITTFFELMDEFEAFIENSELKFKFPC